MSRVIKIETHLQTEMAVFGVPFDEILFGVLPLFLVFMFSRSIIASVLIAAVVFLVYKKLKGDQGRRGMMARLYRWDRRSVFFNALPSPTIRRFVS